MIKTTLLSWQIYVQKYPKVVGGWEKRWQNPCRNCFDLQDTNHLYPSNIALVSVKFIHSNQRDVGEWGTMHDLVITYFFRGTIYMYTYIHT